MMNPDESRQSKRNQVKASSSASRSLLLSKFKMSSTLCRANACHQKQAEPKSHFELKLQLSSSKQQATPTKIFPRSTQIASREPLGETLGVRSRSRSLDQSSNSGRPRSLEGPAEWPVEGAHRATWGAQSRSLMQ